MLYRDIPHCELRPSVFGLGTMTFGEQNSESEARAQLDFAVERGVSFIDTAEMYPVPPREATYGATESIIGNWIADRGNREKIILATKVAGYEDKPTWIRDGWNRFDRANLIEALEGSLRRLKTDHIDLYQLHWPERDTVYFGRREYPWPTESEAEEPWTPLAEVLETLHELVVSGKIRYIGLSNETTWGTMSYLELARKHDWPRVVTIQNPYNLLNRTFSGDLAEMCHREGLRLLAYSPLAFGVLTGKYLHGARPEGTRLVRYKHFQRYTRPQAAQAVQAYDKLARDHGLTLATMALAYIGQRPYTASVLVGATSNRQLEENLGAADVRLDDDLVRRIEKVHERFPNPCP